MGRRTSTLMPPVRGTAWLTSMLCVLVGCYEGSAEDGGEDGSTDATATGGSAGSSGTPTSGGAPTGDQTGDETGDETGGGPGLDDEGSTTEDEPEGFFHTCGRGGPTGDWFTFEVPYPEGTTLADGTPVTTGRYDVFAPPLGPTPYPLVVAFHGDNGNPNATKSDWNYLLEQEAFILVTPQEPHQEVDGGEADNGWDNYSGQTRQFLIEILLDVGDRYDVDIDRLYATGASAGGWFGGQRFFTMQDTFAAVQLSCGSSSMPGYQEPEEPRCKTPARFEIAPSDFLYGASVDAAAFLEAQGNEVVFHETECRGHCCGQPEDYGGAAWEFFSARTYCGTTSPPGCGPIVVLP